MTPVAMFLACIRAAALLSPSFFSLVEWLLLFPVLRRVWNLLQGHLLTVFALTSHSTSFRMSCCRSPSMPLHTAWDVCFWCLYLEKVSVEVLHPFISISLTLTPRDHGRSGAYSSSCNWWITPWRTIHTEGHFIVQGIYFTCKPFQRNQQHLLALVCLWCKFQMVQGKQTHFFHIEEHNFDFKNASSAQQREMRTGGAAKHHLSIRLLDTNHCVNSVLDSEWDVNSW